MLCPYCRDAETGSDDSSVPCKDCCVKEQEFIEHIDMGGGTPSPNEGSCYDPGEVRDRNYYTRFGLGDSVLIPGHGPEACEQELKVFPY